MIIYINRQGENIHNTNKGFAFSNTQGKDNIFYSNDSIKSDVLAHYYREKEDAQSEA